MPLDVQGIPLSLLIPIWLWLLGQNIFSIALFLIEKNILEFVLRQKAQVAPIHVS